MKEVGALRLHNNLGESMSKFLARWQRLALASTNKEEFEELVAFSRMVTAGRFSALQDEDSFYRKTIRPVKTAAISSQRREPLALGQRGPW